MSLHFRTPNPEKKSGLQSQSVVSRFFKVAVSVSLSLSLSARFLFSSFLFSSFLFFAQGVGPLRSRLPASLFEHVSIGQAIHPLTL